MAGTYIIVHFGILLLLGQGSTALRCDWSNGTGQLTPIIPGPPKTLKANDVEECRDQCMSETTFLCAAINYKPSYGECQLLVENEQTTSVSTDNSWQYYIRPLCAGVWQPWIAQKSQYLSGSKYNTTKTENLETCTTRCLRDPSGGEECRSIVMSRSSSDNNCDLHSVREGDGDARVEDNLDWQYFSRPTWYLETSKGATQANMTNQGIAGRLMRVFTEHRLPVSGYLVAWQYYYVTHADSCVRSYAVIMREVGAKAYKMISRTLLAPEEEGVEGVRFQFIQNETIRVEKDDVLAVLTDYNQPIGRCWKNRVSVDHNSGTDTLIVDASTGYQVNDTRDFSAVSYIKMSPSLKAYVAEYLLFDTPPTTHHTLSLTDGQIWLRLPPLPTREDSGVIGGYRVTCSTDDKLVQVVPCNSYLIPVNTRDVLLTLPNVTRTFYAAVQMVRNFNGNDRVETKFPPLTRAFCPGRKRTEQVNVAESESIEDTGKVQFSVNFLHNFSNDEECAKEIKLSTSGYDSGYRAIDDDMERDFALLLDQGVTYDLTIYLKLADGTETKFWTGTHVASGKIKSTTSPGSEWQQNFTNSNDISRTTSKKQGTMTGLSVTVAVLMIYSVVVTAFLIYHKRRTATAEATNTANSTAPDNGRREDAGNRTIYETVFSGPADVEMNENYSRPDQPMDSHVYEKLQHK